MLKQLNLGVFRKNSDNVTNKTINFNFQIFPLSIIQHNWNNKMKSGKFFHSLYIVRSIVAAKRLSRKINVLCFNCETLYVFWYFLFYIFIDWMKNSTFINLEKKKGKKGIKTDDVGIDLHIVPFTRKYLFYKQITLLRCIEWNCCSYSIYSNIFVYRQSYMFNNSTGIVE